MGAGIVATHREGENFLTTRAINTITSANVMKGGNIVAPDFIRMEGIDGMPGYTIYFDNWSTSGLDWRSATQEQREADVELYRSIIRDFSGQSNAFNRTLKGGQYKTKTGKQVTVTGHLQKVYDNAIASGKTHAEAIQMQRDYGNNYLATQFSRIAKEHGASTSIKSRGKWLHSNDIKVTAKSSKGKSSKKK